MPLVPAAGYPVETQPSVEPAGAPPYDYQNIQARPEAFGALTAEATRGFGKEIGQASEGISRAAIERQNLFNQVAAHDASYKMQDGWNKVLHGDPDDPSSVGFFQRHGEDALHAQGDARNAIIKSFNDTRKGLRNSFQQVEFDNETRRLLSMTLNSIGEHANREFDRYSQETNKGTYTVGKQGISADPNNDAAFAAQTEQMIKSAVRGVQLTGGGRDAMDAAVTHARGDAVVTRVEALADTNPGRAMSILEQEKSVIPADHYMRLHNYIENKNEQGEGMSAALSVGGGVVKPSGPLPEGTHPLLPLIHNLEGSKDESVSPKGAIGKGQVLLSTAREIDPDATTEKLHDRAYNDKIASAYLDKLQQQFGNDTGAILVAYNAGPARAQQWLASGRNDAVLPEETRNYLARATNAAIPGFGDKLAALEEKFKDNPKMLARSVSALESLDRAAWAEQQHAEQQHKEASDQLAQGYMARIIKQEDLNGILDEIGNDVKAGKLTWQTGNHLQNAAFAETQKVAEKDTKHYGTGFWDTYQRVVAPDDTPGKITDVNEILRRAGPTGDLSLAGAQKLVEIMQSKKTPEGEANAALEKEFFKWAHGEMVGERVPGVAISKDPKGEELFQKFQIQAYQAIAAGKAAGKTPMQLFNPESPDFVGKSLTVPNSPFKRPMEEFLRDMIPDQTSQQTFDKPEDLKAAVAKGTITRDVGIKIAKDKGWIDK